MLPSVDETGRRADCDASSYGHKQVDQGNTLFYWGKQANRKQVTTCSELLNKHKDFKQIVASSAGHIQNMERYNKPHSSTETPVRW